MCQNIAEPIPIPDSPEPAATHQVTETESGVITDLNVCLNIEHTWPGDLVVVLSRGSIKVDLLRRPGSGSALDPGCSQDNVLVYLDDADPDWVQDVCDPVPLIGVFRPAEPLSAFNGQDRSGTWTLSLSDNSPDQDVGSLTGFSMTFVTVTPTPTAAATP